MFLLPDEINKALELLGDYKTYLVGGAVRDLLLNRKVSDYDIVTNATFEKIKEIFSEYKEYSSSNFKHETLGVIIGKYKLEISTLKGNDIYDDFNHRDFTINAIAYNKELIYHAKAMDDLNNKIIRTTNSPDVIFKEDPLRILRALRFSLYYNFEIDEETKAKMFELKNLLKDIPYERINPEFSKIIRHYKAYKYLDTYRDIIAVFIPEIKIMFDFDQRSRYHQHDLYTHTLYVLKGVEDDLDLKLAAFFHDIGKPAAVVFDQVYGDRIYHYPYHPERSVEIAGPILKRMKYSQNRIKDVLHLIELHDYGFNYKISNTRRVLYLLGRNYEVLFPKLLKLKQSDYDDHINLENLIVDLNRVKDNYNKIIENHDCFKIEDMNISGLDLLNIGYEKDELKYALDRLIRSVMKDKVKNNHEDLINYSLNNKEELLKYYKR